MGGVWTYRGQFENITGNSNLGVDLVSSSSQGEGGTVARLIGQTCHWQLMPITGAELREVGVQLAKVQPKQAQSSESTAYKDLLLMTTASGGGGR